MKNKNKQSDRKKNTDYYDITEPGNEIRSSTTDYPSNEGPEKVIDNNVNTKYLNFTPMKF